MADQGPIETAYVEIKPKVDANFAKDLRRQIMPIIKQISKEANKAFQEIGSSSKAASSGVSGLSRSLSGATKSANNFASAAAKAGSATAGLHKAAGSASAALRQTDAGAREAGRGAQEAGNRFNFLARALIVGAVYAAGQALVNLGQFGLQAAANLEQTRVAFTGLLGDMRAAEDFTIRLQKFAAVTPFEFEGLAKGTQRLLALGQTSEEAIATLTDVGNAAAAVGADETAINRVIVALAQISAKGKLSAEEINQVGEALPNLDRGALVENLAEKFQVTTDKIREMQEKGLIPAKEGTEALLETLREVPGALGAMDRQAQTLQGRLSTFKDTVKADFSNALQDALPQLGTALGTLTTTISAQLQTFGPALADALVTVTPLINGLVEALGPAFTQILNATAPVLASLAPALAPLGAVIANTFGVLGPALTTIGTALAPIIAIIGTELASAIQQLAPLMSEIGTGIARVLIDAAPMLQELLASIVPVVTVLADSLIPVVGVLADTFVQLLPSLLPAIVAFADLTVAVAPLIQLIGVALTAAIEALGPVFNLAVTTGIGVMITAMQALTFTIREVVIPILKFFVGFVLEVFANIAEAGAQAFGWVPGLGPKLQGAAENVRAFKDQVNADLARIQREVNIVVRTTYVTAKVELNNIQDEKAFAREQRRRAIAAAAPKKPIITGGGVPQFLPARGGGSSGGGGGGSSAESEAKKAAKAVKDAMIKLADAALDAAKKVADGIKDKLGDAESALKKLRDQFAEIRDSIKDAFSVDLFESRSAKQFLKRASKNIARNTSVFQAQGVLQSRLGAQAGGSDFLRQLFESGNTRLIKNLASQSSATLNEVLAKFNQDNALATKIGTAVAEAYRVNNRPLVVGISLVRDEVIRLKAALVVALAKVEAATKARDRLKAAAGGIFSSATDLQVGEAGREVVVPLTRPAAALDLLLKSGALALPTVAAHIGRLEEASQRQSMDLLRGLTPTGRGSQAAPAPRPLSLVPPVKVVKERTVNQTFNITEAGDARLTAASVAARTASHMDR